MLYQGSAPFCFSMIPQSAEKGFEWRSKWEIRGSFFSFFLFLEDWRDNRMNALIECFRVIEKIFERGGNLTMVMMGRGIYG